MWKQFKLENYVGEFRYKLDNNTFFLNCFSPSSNLDRKRLFVHSSSSNVPPLCLGSFSSGEKGFYLEKIYPLSFFETNGISICDGKDTLFSLNQTEEATPKDALEDPALIRAKELVENHPITPEDKKMAIEKKEEFEKKLSAYPIITLPIPLDYTFHILDNIRHPFELSAIDHIVHSSEFVSAFVKSGEWYLGEKKESSVFVLCIATGKDDINPMYNASDCDTIYESDNVFYHIVGIELCFDGQYFCTIEIE